MNIHELQGKKKRQQKITMITCYDHPSAKIINETNIDCVLVGDSVAMAVHGHPNTLMADMPMMILHTQAVRRGLQHALLVSDLPFLAHRGTQADTVYHVKQLLQAGAHAVKIEGGDAHTCSTIAFLTQSGIPVFGHIGLTPQSIHQLGGFKVQGKNAIQVANLLDQAQALEQSGCVALVIECVPQEVGKLISEQLQIPTIGIGAGNMTDGQVLVWHDLLGIQDDFHPRFLKQYAQSKPLFIAAINQYVEQVQMAHFPSEEHSY